MIVLDTNVLSEAMKPLPAAPVAAWMVRESLDSLFTTTVTEAEIRLGIEVLPAGRRKQDLVAAAQRIIAMFDARILPFDRGAAVSFARIVAARRREGLPSPTWTPRSQPLFARAAWLWPPETCATSMARGSKSLIHGAPEPFPAGKRVIAWQVSIGRNALPWRACPASAAVRGFFAARVRRFRWCSTIFRT